MNTADKKFDELTLYELFNILKLRSEVFTQEQKITYADPDDNDLIAHHVFINDHKKIIAYARYFIEDDNILIGRVVVAQDSRGKGLAKKLIRDVLQGVKANYGDKTVLLHSQVYIKKLYHELGFKESGNVFEEAGVKHIMMKHAPLNNRKS